MTPYSLAAAEQHRDVFTTLPPELLTQIWDDDTLQLAPSAIAISKTHLLHARRNAYRSLHIDSDITLAALGEQLGQTPYLGLLVDEIEIKEEAKSRSGLEADFTGAASWLEASFIKAFEGMPHVKKISITRCNPGELLSARIMASAAFKSATTLQLASGDNIDYSALRNLHLSPSLKTLDIKTPMRYQAGMPSGLFEPSMSGIEKLAMSAEPHSADFEAFFEHLRLRELDLRSGTTDAHRVFESLGDSTRQNLRSLSFTSTGYHERNVDAALIGFHSLERLSIVSSQLSITPTFFSTLQHLPLVSLVFHGPRNPLLGHVLDWLQSNEQPTTLKEIGVDVSVVRKSSLSGEVPMWSRWRKEDDVSRLAAICAKTGVKLAGTICDALLLIPRAAL
ncbi:hypothetical protein BCR35DRAFT_53189 [Leucosporidium creatinivorum]|uniref:F-box domain-containing protein n=1 Tax=Leucosporidium creatinivorum TaxID=106004 RepID=A0A1Y2FMW2_9BASI|nr:hypothetical protein BCR35DRAFT_53189 [Leucosporidium creatinivorum]